METTFIETEIVTIQGKWATIVTNLDFLGYAYALYDDIDADLGDDIIAVADWLHDHRDQWRPATRVVQGVHPNLGWREDVDGAGEMDAWEIGPEAVAAMVTAVTAA